MQYQSTQISSFLLVFVILLFSFNQCQAHRGVRTYHCNGKDRSFNCIAAQLQGADTHLKLRPGGPVEGLLLDVRCTDGLHDPGQYKVTYHFSNKTKAISCTPMPDAAGDSSLSPDFCSNWGNSTRHMQLKSVTCTFTKDGGVLNAPVI